MATKKSVTRKARRYSNKIESSLLAVFSQATEQELNYGRNWYRIAHSTSAQIALRYDLTIAQAAGVIAALSPSSMWDKNVADAKSFIAAYVDGLRGEDLPKVGTYGQGNRTKAEKILSGQDPLEVLGGNKVTSFYSNILNPESDSTVTIDRHAKSAALGYSVSDNEASLGVLEYRAMVRQYRAAGAKVQMLGNEFQAVVWVVWRRLKGIADAMEVTA